MEYISSILALSKSTDFQTLAQTLGKFLQIDRYDGSAHPDVIVISPQEKKTNISITQVRELFARSSFRPTFAPKTSILFFPAESLSLPAQQSLLKILEEPPARTQIFLITHAPYALLPTILSRCTIIPIQLEHASSPQQKFPTSVGGALQMSDKYPTRDKAMAYLQELIETLATQIAKAPANTAVLTQASIALGLLEKNCSVKLVLDTFFLSII